MSEAKERGGSRSEDLDSKSSKRVSSDVEEEDSTILPDEAKPPRRASVGWGNERASEKPSGEAAAAASSGASTSGGGSSDSKRPGRRRKGGDSGTGGSISDSKAKNRHFDDDQESTDIVEIPDLEEEEREQDITMQIADAPKNTTRSVQSLKELDRDIKFSLPTTVAFGVDLSLLTSCLCPEKAVIESDETWNFDGLLNEVSQEMQKDLDEKEEMLKADGA
ncbi:hypothetical protein Poli38472_004731 [Pythium oligandrum]|uniref:Intraflagellar transport protein 43 homolog n=1 Tax=Pythium oligandrum TaxID=41045 RepID=A0A8K1CAM6_PYTOL|nr:hypothetical protein Poli38472_004731 [Pythium oligandrum]|eukprot:TMW59662.1 hypothetical protein Poli38472_004731 [Pythium oligandrum]